MIQGVSGKTYEACEIAVGTPEQQKRIRELIESLPKGRFKDGDVITVLATDITGGVRIIEQFRMPDPSADTE